MGPDRAGRDPDVVSADISLLARHGLLNLLGTIASGLLSFLVIVVVTRGLRASGAGLFFEGVALFSLGSNVLLFGADVGLLKWISADRALRRNEAVRHTLTAAIVPTFVASIVIALTGFLLMPHLARLLAHGADVRDLTPYLRLFVIALPFSVVYLECIAATRGFGTMVPSVLIDKVGKPSLQLLLIGISVLAGLSSTALAVAWTAPVGVGLLLALSWLVLRIRRLEPRLAAPRPRPAHLFSAFWRFAAPRGLAGIFYVVILWLDTLLLGILRSPREAGIYTASSRYVLLAGFVGIAVTQAVSPQIGEYLTRKETARARSIYQTATAWVMAVAWPIQLTLAVFAMLVLMIFGSGFEEGGAVLTILAISMLVATGTGPVDWVLLMGGKSSWNLLNTAAALVLNIGLNLLLIPRLGMVGAAVAWGVSIVVNNLAPLIEVWLLMRLNPFGPGFRLVGMAALLVFGAGGLAVRLLFEPSLALFAVFCMAASAVYLIILTRFRERLHAGLLLDAVRSRRTARTETDPSSRPFPIE